MPINDFVGEASGRMCAWLLEGVIDSLFFRKTVLILAVADVPDAESYFYAHEFLDVTVQPKPIYISPNEVYTMHGLLLQHLRFLVRHQNLISQQGLRSHWPKAPQSDDTLRIILNELLGVPNLADEELKDARDTAITLELTNRFATVKGHTHYLL